MNRLSKKMLPVILAISLMGGINSLAFADVAIEAGAGSVTQAAYGVGAGDVVYFGSYPQSVYAPTNTPGTPVEGRTYTDADGTQFVYSNSQYLKIEPIAWRVLSNTGNNLFLLADKNLDAQSYNTQRVNVTWETSTVRSWLNDYTAGQAGASVANPYTDSFINTAFSAPEQTAITTTPVINGATSNPSFPALGGNDTQDKVFLLSIQEAQNTTYGFANNASRVAPLTAYAIARGAYNYGGNGYWWLRSPGNRANYAARVLTAGGVGSYGDGGRNDWPIESNRVGVRPALNLNLASVIFTSAASGTETKSVSTVGANFSEAQTLSGPVKFTVQGASQTLEVLGTTSQSTQSASTLTFGYANATTGTNQYVSAVLVNGSGDVAYYTKLADSLSTPSDTLSIPLTGVADGSYTLKVFSEQANGDNLTDFASTPITMTLVVASGTGTVSDFVAGGGIIDDAPLLSAPSVDRTGDANATVEFFSDEAGTYYYQLDGPVPTAASLVSSGGVGTALVSGANTISLTTPTTGAHTLYVAGKDTLNVSNLLTITIPAYVPVDKTAMNAALTTANPITQGAYTTAVWTGFAAARTSATGVFNDAAATQAEVDAATTALTAAYGALKVTDGGHRFLNDVNEHSLGTTGGLIHIVNHDRSLHTAVVKVDGNTLTEGTDYTSASGSTQTTLKASYLDTLGVGTHTLTVEFSSGIAPASDTFEILAAGSGDGASDGSGGGLPSTGDSGLLPALLAGFLALTGVSLSGIAGRRRKYAWAHRK